jgi:phosphoglycolate phosphatase-like HAD superfamily hydrolase
MDLNGIQIYIFDVNGVLIDSNVANAEAMGKAFTDDISLQQRVAEYYLKLTGIDRGSKIRSIQEKLVKRPFADNEFELRWELFKKLSRKTMMKAPLGAGAKEILIKLGEMGRKRVALSNTPPDELDEILKGHGLDKLLDIIRGGGNWPKSESLSRLLEEFQFKPGDCFFLADGKGDLKAARRADIAFGAIDPGTGEFEGENGIEGPYRNLAEWGQKVGLISLRK